MRDTDLEIGKSCPTCISRRKRPPGKLVLKKSGGSPAVVGCGSHYNHFQRPARPDEIGVRPGGSEEKVPDAE